MEENEEQSTGSVTPPLTGRGGETVVVPALSAASLKALHDRAVTVFRSYDVNNTGTLDSYEVVPALAELGIVNGFSTRKLGTLLTNELPKLDMPEGPSVSLDEFKQVCEKLFAQQRRIPKDEVNIAMQNPRLPAGAENNAHLKRCFISYCSYGVDPSKQGASDKLNSLQFFKLFEESGLMAPTGPLAPVAVDIIFAKSKRKGAVRLTYQDFLRAVAFAADDTNMDFMTLQALLKSYKPNPAGGPDPLVLPRLMTPMLPRQGDRPDSRSTIKRPINNQPDNLRRAALASNQAAKESFRQQQLQQQQNSNNKTHILVLNHNASTSRRITGGGGDSDDYDASGAPLTLAAIPEDAGGSESGRRTPLLNGTGNGGGGIGNGDIGGNGAGGAVAGGGGVGGSAGGGRFSALNTDLPMRMPLGPKSPLGSIGHEQGARLEDFMALVQALQARVDTLEDRLAAVDGNRTVTGSQSSGSSPAAASTSPGPLANGINGGAGAAGAGVGAKGAAAVPATAAGAAAKGAAAQTTAAAAAAAAQAGTSPAAAAAANGSGTAAATSGAAAAAPPDPRLAKVDQVETQLKALMTKTDSIQKLVNTTTASVKKLDDSWQKAAAHNTQVDQVVKELQQQIKKLADTQAKHPAPGAATAPAAASAAAAAGGAHTQLTINWNPLQPSLSAGQVATPDGLGKVPVSPGGPLGSAAGMAEDLAQSKPANLDDVHEQLVVQATYINTLRRILMEQLGHFNTLNDQLAEQRLHIQELEKVVVGNTAQAEDGPIMPVHDDISKDANMEEGAPAP